MPAVAKRKARKKPETAPPQVALARTQDRNKERAYGPKAQELFKQIVAPGAPDEHVALVFHYARALELDPLRKQVMLLEMPKKNKELSRPGADVWEKSYTVLVGIHGLLGKIQRHKEYGGIASSAVFAGEQIAIAADGTVAHTYDPTQRPKGEAAVPIGAWATVTRVLHNQRVKHTAWVSFAEVVLTKWNERTRKREPRELWAKMPAVMTEKCAKAFAIRMAFDDEVGGVHVPEEFGGRELPDGSVEIDETMKLPESVADTAEASMAEVVEDHPQTVEAAFDEGAIKAGLVRRLVTIGDEWGARDKRDVISRQLDGSLWVVDSETLKAAGHEGPSGLLLSAASLDQLQAMFDFVQTKNRESQARGGRAR